MTIVFLITTAICFVAWIWAKVSLHLCEGELQCLEDCWHLARDRAHDVQRQGDKLRKVRDELQTSLDTLRRNRDEIRTTRDQLRRTLSRVAQAVKRDREAHDEHIENLKSLRHHAIAAIDPTFLDAFIAEYGPQESTEAED